MIDMPDAPFHLDRFITAQEGVFDTAVAELTSGRKRSHWMWFIFPQLQGLGVSPTARFYGIAALDEARAYLAHPVLGPRLEDATRAAIAAPARTLHDLFGSPDDLKFRSSMTLFEAAADGGLFCQALDRCCDGERDPRTLSLLGITES